MLIKGKMIPFTQSNNKTSRSSNRKEKTKNNNAKKQIKLDNRNQVEFLKKSIIFHDSYCMLKTPEEKMLFFRVA